MSKLGVFAIACVTSLYVVASAHAADELLSGAITGRSGEKLEGVTVSAKLEGSTITTSVYTDARAFYVFPPLPPGKYRVWAQALGFETSKGCGRSLGGAHGRTSRSRRSPIRAALPAVAGRDDGRSAARGDPAGRAHEEDLHEQLHRVPFNELRAAVPVRRSGVGARSST